MAVHIEDLQSYKGEESWRIATRSATYVLHKRSGGLASLIDPNGNDWISFSRTEGSSGEFRGIPNLGRRDGGFHPGRPGCRTSITHTDANKVVARVDSDDLLWRTEWTFTDDHLAITVQAASHPYWFLYEGTPGGAYDETACVGVDAGGNRWRCTEIWERRIPEPRWVYFQTEGYPYVLLLQDAGDRPDTTVDSFWSMQRNMTVFGFGRIMDHRSDRWAHLTETPATFYVSLQAAPEDPLKPVHIPGEL